MRSALLCDALIIPCSNCNLSDALRTVAVCAVYAVCCYSFVKADEMAHTNGQLKVQHDGHCGTGEDVGHYGGSYKVSYDLHKKYGDMRLLDTPICGTLCSPPLHVSARSHWGRTITAICQREQPGSPSSDTNG